MGNCKQCLNTNLLVIFTLFGGIIGLSVGFSLRKWTLSTSTLLWIGILGEMYIRMLKMMIIPLIVSSIITATASLDIKSNGRISIVCLTYTMITNFLPTVLGSLLCLIIQPGRSVSEYTDFVPLVETHTETQDIFADLLRNVFPDNLVVATFEQAHTKYRFIEKNNSYSGNISMNLTHKEKVLGSAYGTNVIGLIVASSICGMATSALKEKGKAFYDVFVSATHVFLQMLRWLIWFTPVGIASLLAKIIASSRDTGDEFRHLGMFILTVMLGFLLWSLVIVPVAYFIVKKSNPFRFLFTLLEPILIVLATSSTAIAMPETLNSLENINKFDKRITRFVVPISASIGRGGTCLYITTSCLFVIQLVGTELTPTKVILVCILSTISALANPPVTGASLVNIILILTALDIPPEAASLLYAFDWLLDRFRSVTNLFTHALCVVVTYELSSSVLPSHEEEEENLNVYNADIGIGD